MLLQSSVYLGCMTCISCIQGFPWECTEGCNGNAKAEPILDINWTDTGDDVPSDLDVMEQLVNAGRSVRAQDDSKLRDQQSTGRKRAAVMYPLDPTAPCEWQGKKNCGGGEFPITGCESNLQEARHHGPDKNTLNNEPGNVHRICPTCHNRWHTLNDPDYKWGDVYESHSPIPATAEDMKASVDFWKGRKLTRPQH